MFGSDVSNRTKPHRDSSSITAVALGSVNKLLAIGRRDGSIEIYDRVGSGHCLSAWSAHHLHVSSLAWDEDDNQLASTSPDNKVVVWNWTSAAAVQTGKGVGGSTETLFFSARRLTLAVGFVDGSVRLWNPWSGVELNNLQSSSQHVMALGFDAVGQRLCAIDRKRRLWQWALGQTKAQLLGYAQTNVCGFVYLPQDQSLLDENVWDLPTQSLLAHGLILILDDNV